MLSFHLLRPWFLLGVVPCLLLYRHVRHQQQQTHGWQHYVDHHLQKELLLGQESQRHFFHHAWWMMLGLACLALAGPAWKKLPLPSFTSATAKIILLDISSSMLVADLTPNRLQRAKFLIQDALHTPEALPLGLIAYTSEPFLVSPITEDARTIEALLPDLEVQTAPVDGNQLSSAIVMAVEMFKKSKSPNGALWVLTGTPPNDAALVAAQHAHQQGYEVSIMQVAHANHIASAFQRLAEQGHGNASLIESTQALHAWLSSIQHHQKELKQALARIPQWQDEGPWFIIPILLIFIGLFQKNRIRSLLE